jgi:isopropylmalate/homocitrate/citramalate synthase
MLAKNMYPKCATSFRMSCLSNQKLNEFYNKMGKPFLFDVTLRDGLQALSKEEQKEFTTNKKLEIYKGVITNYEVKNVEIGSIVSEKVLPIFKDTLQLLEATKNNQTQKQNEKINNFILVPNKEKLKTIIDNVDVQCFSFITSISNSFQVKNTKMNLKQSDQETYEMLQLIHKKIYQQQQIPIVKLYVSCINECPIEGKIDNDFIVNRILILSKMNVDNICLSDTCGTITVDDFEYIIETIIYFGLSPNRISLHLHVKPDREDIVEQIIHKALEFKINQFDVSNLKTGGCSVTISKKNLASNLSYELFYKSLINYIKKKTK